jgi:hypothetical protein
MWLKSHWEEVILGIGLVTVGGFVIDAQVNLKVMRDKYDNADKKIEDLITRGLDKLDKRLDEQQHEQQEKVQASQTLLSDVNASFAVYNTSNGLNCSEDYEQSVAIIKDLARKLKPRPLPETYRRGLYINLLTGYIGSGQVMSIPAKELAEIEPAILSEEFDRCGDRGYLVLAACYLASNDTKKAKRLILAGIEKNLKKANEGAKSPELELHYGVLIIVAAAEMDVESKEDREKRAWDLFMAAYDRYPVPPTWISAYLGKDGFLDPIVEAMKFNRPSSCNDAIKSILRRLDSGELKVHEINVMHPNNKIVKRYVRTDGGKPKPPNAPPPTATMSVEPPPAKCCGSLERP